MLKSQLNSKIVTSLKKQYETTIPNAVVVDLNSNIQRIERFKGEFDILNKKSLLISTKIDNVLHNLKMNIRQKSYEEI